MTGFKKTGFREEALLPGNSLWKFMACYGKTGAAKYRVNLENLSVNALLVAMD